MGGGEQVDLILTDPPYLINYYSKHRKKGDKFTTPILNDNNPPIIQTALNNMCGILKDKSAFYCFCNDKSVDWFKNVLGNHLKFKNLLIWLKNGRTGGDLKGAYAKTTELVLYYSKNRHLLNGGRDTDVLSFNRVTGKKQLHQNQKPLELLCFLVGKSSDVGGVVFA